jgi:DNA-binding transcriptional regulator LsrR (DeoR family)
MIDYSRKITREDATRLRRTYWRTGCTQAALAGQFGISPSQVCQIIHRKSWHGPRVTNEPMTRRLALEEQYRASS